MDFRPKKRSSISLGAANQRSNNSFNNNISTTISNRQPSILYSSTNNNLGQKACCTFNFNLPLFSVDWSDIDLVAVGSYKEDSFNKLAILQSSSDLVHWSSFSQSNITYPISKIQWMPRNSTKLGTCSDSLRIWSLNDKNIQEQVNLSICKYMKHNNGNDTSSNISLGNLPPITSFDWNIIDTNIILSCSIDTTCTVWDLQSSNYVKTQLIAHDSEVFDSKFLSQSTQLFASCGGDGSVRVFDLRSLAHSTIIYEPQSQSPNSPKPLQNKALLRLAPSPFDPNIIGAIEQDSNVVIILDMRYPGIPILNLEAHISAVNQIQWHPITPNLLASCGDDCQILYWDIKGSLPKISSISNSNSHWGTNSILNSFETPQMAYTDNLEVNNLVWRPQGDWIGSIVGKNFKSIKVR